MGRWDRIVFGVLAGATAAYVIARSLLVPMVHDECASVLWFVQPGEWLPDRSHWDANNHFLSTGIGVFLYRAFGMGTAVLRAGSIAAFALYVWATWRLGHRLHDRRIRWCFWAALLLCPFVLDFFSMFRGYGFALAGIMIAVDGLFSYATGKSMRSLVQALLGCLLGGAAIVALVPVWGILVAVLGTLLIRHLVSLSAGQRLLQALSIMLLGFLPMAYAAVVSLRLQELGLLYHGSLEGFVAVTVASLARYVVGSDAWPVLAVILCAAFFAMAAATVRFRSTGAFSSPLVLVTFLLAADVLARIVLAHGFRVNFPEDRAGIHFVPLLLIAVVLAMDAITLRWKAAVWSCLPLLFLPARSLWTANLDHCLLWPEQCVPRRFVQRISQEENALGRPLLIGAYHQLALAIPFAARAAGVTPPSVQGTDFPEGPHDLRVVDRRFIGKARKGFEVLDSASGPGLWLLRRLTYGKLLETSRTASSAWSGAEEFHELAVLDTALVRSGATRVLVSVPLTLPRSSPDITCVVQITDGTGKDLRYETSQPCVLRPDWMGEPFVMLRSFPPLPSAARGVVYFYDPKRKGLRIGEGTVTMWKTAP